MLNGFEIIFPFVRKTSSTAVLKSHSTHGTFPIYLTSHFYFPFWLRYRKKKSPIFFQSLPNSFLAIYLPANYCVFSTFEEISFENTNQDFRFRVWSLWIKLWLWILRYIFNISVFFGLGKGDSGNKYILSVIWHSRYVEGVPSLKFRVWSPRVGEI